MKNFRLKIGLGGWPISCPPLPTGFPGLVAVVFLLSVIGPGGAAQADAARVAADSTILRFAAPPAIISLPGGAGAIEWSAAVDCAPPVDLASLIGARVFFAFDLDLDGVADIADSMGVSPADCGESDAGRINLLRRFTAAHPAVLRATLRTAAGVTTAAHELLTSGTGSLLSISRYCARPKNGEPEWVEVRNHTAFTVPLAAVRLEARALTGTLDPGASFVAGSDTAELRLWQPGARLVALSSWSNLRNSGDTLRLALSEADGMLMLDSLVYGAGFFPREECASLQSEESGAGAHGYALEVSPARWRPGKTSLSISVTAPVDGRFDLRAYDIDGAEQCVLVRNATGATGASGAASFSFPHPACANLDAQRGVFILHLQPGQPRTAPSIRKAFRITE